jgi:hypothetical protein
MTGPAATPESASHRIAAHRSGNAGQGSRMSATRPWQFRDIFRRRRRAGIVMTMVLRRTPAGPLSKQGAFTMRTHRTIAVALAVTALVGPAGAGVAQAAPATAGAPAPSACRPANHTAKIIRAPGGAGYRHYRVTLTAPRGYAPCSLAGSPTGVRFSHHDSDSGVRAGHYGGRGTTVTFGPGHPVHFDIRVPAGVRAVAADEASFTLQAPRGEIPGTSFAEGRLDVARGTGIGPVRRGA